MVVSVFEIVVAHSVNGFWNAESSVEAENSGSAGTVGVTVTGATAIALAVTTAAPASANLLTPPARKSAFTGTPIR